MARRVLKSSPEGRGQPIAFFKASTGIDDLSWNSGFHLLASWGLRLQGVPVVYFACEAGMSRCVLGTHRDDVRRAPPCGSCIQQSRTLYTDVPESADAGAGSSTVGSQAHWFTYERDPALERALGRLGIRELTSFSWPQIMPEATAGREAARRPASDSKMVAATGPGMTIPLGELCLPGLRWILRRHSLDDDEDTRLLLREYIQSAWNVAQKFARFLDEANPRAVVVFNGQFFPEATARYVAQARGLRVITHEVGLLPASAFFTDGDATAYPIHIPDDFELDRNQNAVLDSYLEKRFQGRFSMAGIQFWPRMRGLDVDFLARATKFKQLVSVFTNVIFDTSQPQANTVFPDMFAWLDMVLGAMKAHPETLFVIRAHPDEVRVRKESHETVQGWVEQNGLDLLGNAEFIGPKAYLSSYELIQRSKFVMVYNSTIGLEASIMGKPVLCGGRARFTQYPTVFFPPTIEEQTRLLEGFLGAQEIEVPGNLRRNARRFLYYQLFRTSLPFGEFLTPSVRTTQTRLKTFELDALAGSEAIRVVSDGLLNGREFLREESRG
jgi:hypothetical protein